MKHKNPDFLNRKETADLLKISYPTLHLWVKKGILTPKKLGSKTYFLMSDILETMNNESK